MNLFDLLPARETPQAPLCSRKGCRELATMQLLWNNPKIHTADRRKIWLACQDHVARLEDYLQSRSLWKETLPMSPKDSA
ncbi:MAG: acetone carboxylase [Specibacter sp.]